MTDHAVQPTLTPQEQAAIVVADANRLAQDIANQLNAIHAEADPKRRQALTRACWNNVDELNKTVEESAYMVGIASDMMMMLQEQRDHAVDAIQTLIQDITGINRENPLIAEMVEGVEDEYTDSHERAMERVRQQAFQVTANAQGAATKDQQRRTSKILQEYFFTDENVAQFWARLFSDGYGLDYLDEDTRRSLGQWMAEQIGAAHAST